MDVVDGGVFDGRKRGHVRLLRGSPQQASRATRWRDATVHDLRRTVGTNLATEVRGWTGDLPMSFPAGESCFAASLVGSASISA